MAKLIVNVWARGEGFGPGFGDRQPPSDLWDDLPAEVWSGGVTPQVDDTVRQGGGVVAGGAGGGQVSPPADPPPVVDYDDDLAGLDKAALLEVADMEDVDVDRRLGPQRLRARIRAARREARKVAS